MNVKFCLAFPCEAVSIPVMRRVLGDTLRNLGVVDDCIGDILVAVTEACTNVLRHSATRRYEVVASVGRGGCLVEVVDSGQGLGQRRGAPPRGAQRGRAADQHMQRPDRRTGARVRQTAEQPPPVSGRTSHGQRLHPMPPARRPEDQMIARLPESGRGLQIMRALVDDVTLQSGPERGTVVSMRKRVTWRRDAPLVGLSGRELRDTG